MLSRFSSLKHLSHLPTSLPLSHMSSLSIRPAPKTYLKPVFDELTPKRVTITETEKKNVIFSSQALKKYQDKTKELLHEFVHLVVHGSKSAYKDARNLYSIKTSKSKSEYTVEEIREVKRITVDLIKFVPFYASIIIPAGELALIPYLFLFPRAVPSYFLGEKAIKENKDKYMENQFKAHQYLKEHLLKVMAQAGYDASSKDPERMKKFFVENKDKLLPFLGTQQMDSEMLKNASDFLMFDYIEGNYIVNLMYKTTVNLPRYGVNLAMWIAKNTYRAAWNHPVFDYSFKMNSFIFEGAKRRLLKYQFEKQLETVKNQNQAMLSNLFGNLREETVLDIAKERGFYSDCPGKAGKWLKEEWKQVSEAHMGDDNMCLFWRSVIQYESL